jgi:hypothetical protein
MEESKMGIEGAFRGKYHCDHFASLGSFSDKMIDSLLVSDHCVEL